MNKILVGFIALVAIGSSVACGSTGGGNEPPSNLISLAERAKASSEGNTSAPLATSDAARAEPWVAEIEVMVKRALSKHPIATLEQIELSGGALLYHFEVDPGVDGGITREEAAFLDALMAEVLKVTAEALKADTSVNEVWIAIEIIGRDYTTSNSLSRDALVSYKGSWEKLLQETTSISR